MGTVLIGRIPALWRTRAGRGHRPAHARGGADPPGRGKRKKRKLLKPPSPKARQKMVFGMVLEALGGPEEG